jgi:hypothetical protein
MVGGGRDARVLISVRKQGCTLFFGREQWVMAREEPGKSFGDYARFVANWDDWEIDDGWCSLAVSKCKTSTVLLCINAHVHKIEEI